MKKQEIIETIRCITAAAKSPTNTFLCNGMWLSQEAAIRFWTMVLEMQFPSVFVGKLRYVKRIVLCGNGAYSEVLQQFDGDKWNDVDADDAVWETPEEEEKYNKAQAKEYRNQFR